MRRWIKLSGDTEMKEHRKEQKKKGFTLVEVIVVLVIIGILMAILIPALTGYISKAKTRSCEVRRSSMQRYFKAAYAGEDALRDCTDIVELKQAAGQDILGYMVEHGYCEEEDTECPVYHQKYDIDFFVEADGKMNIDFICPCNETSLGGYLALAKNFYDGKLADGSKYNDRKDLIEDLYNKRGSLLKVSSQFTKGTAYEGGKEMYWRPYYLNDGTMVMYATNENSATHAQWRGALMYVDGKVYELPEGVKEKPYGKSISWLSTVGSYEEADKMLQEKGYQLVK